MQKIVLTIILLIAVTITAWALWVAFESPPAPAPPPPAEEQAPPPPVTPPTPAEKTMPAETAQEPETSPEPEVVLPPLQDSDGFVRERLQPMALPDSWLKQGDYVRRLAVLAENAARGQYPRRQLAFLAPRDPFKVIRRDDRIYVDPKGYDRYDRYVTQLETVDPQQLAGLLETIRPLVASALGELGVDAPPDKMYQAAINEVLAVPVLEEDGSVELVQPNVMYEYANPELESLGPLEKQVLRMGPANVQRLQTYLRRLARQMSIDVGP